MSPTEKTVTNKDLTRVMVKTWSWMQTVTMDVLVQWMELSYNRRSQDQRQ